MNICLKDSLKTRMDENLDNKLVFTTSKTMHERFTPKHQRCVFILKEGCNGSFKNNDANGRIVFPNKKIKTRNFSCDRNSKAKNKIKTKQQLNRLAEKRRTVLMPEKLHYENDMEFIDYETLPLSFLAKKFYCSTPKDDSTTGKHSFITKRFSSWNTRSQNRKLIFSPVCLSNKNPYVWRSSSKWRRKYVTKAQLDDEIDEYMAEVKPKPSTVSNDNNNDDDAYLEEYFMKAENLDEDDLLLL